MNGQQLIPMLSYEDGPAAMDWLIAAFGLVEKRRWLDDAGRLTHGELVLGDQMVMLASPPDYSSPNTLQQRYPDVVPWLRNPWIYNGVLLTVPDLNLALNQALNMGAELLSPVEDGPPGRCARLADIEGHRWFLIETSMVS